MLYIYLMYSKEFNKFLFEQGSMYDLPKVKEGSKLQGNPLDFFKNLSIYIFCLIKIFLKCI